MACGLKKQNIPEGGVHLTERTCSPYNPIIKQIVDDCLGLPIYPVTSVDAVIDEDGNTLRTLFEDLVINVKEGNVNITEIGDEITRIWNTINNLNEDYTTSNDFNAYKEIIENKLKLLYRISSMNLVLDGNDQDLRNYAGNTDADPSKPYIVKYIEGLETAIRDITGDENGGGGTSLKSLENLINDLRDLVIAIANYDEESHDDDGLVFQEGNDNQYFQIVYEIKKLKEQLGPGSGEGSLPSQIESLRGALDALTEMVYGIAKCGADSNSQSGIYDDGNDHITHIVDLVNDIKNYIDPTNVGNNSLYYFIVNKITEITGGEVDLSGYAHLDSELSDLSVNKLAGEEYPVTGANFMPQLPMDPILEQSSFSLAKLISDLYTTHKARNNPYFVYFPNNTVIGNSSPSLRDYDYNSDGQLDILDLQHAINCILGIEQRVNNKEYDPNHDGEKNIGDVNFLIDIILSDEDKDFRLFAPKDWSKYIYEFHEVNSSLITTPSIYEGEIEELFPGFQIIKHPLIEGKLYTDFYTKLVYRYNDMPKYGEMIAVGATINVTSADHFQDLFLSLQTEGDGQYNENEFGKKYTVELKLDNNKCFYNTRKDDGGTYVRNDGTPYPNKQLFITLDVYTTVSYNNNNELAIFWTEPESDNEFNSTSPTRRLTIGSKRYILKNQSLNDFAALEIAKLNIADVTFLIDCLLKGTFIGIHTLFENEFASIKEYVDSIQPGPGINETVLNQLKTALNNHNPEPPSFTSSSNPLYGCVYIVKNGMIDVVRVNNDEYYNYAKMMQQDYDLNLSTNIADVTNLIDRLLTGLETWPITHPNVLLGTFLYQLLGEDLVQITNEVAGADRRIFNVIYEDEPVRDYVFKQYYFDYLGAFRPVLSKLKLEYISNENTLLLKDNDLTVSHVRLGSGKSISTSSQSPIIRNLGPNSTPYLFGSSVYNWTKIFDDIVDDDSLDSGDLGSVINDNSSGGVANLISSGNESEMPCYLDENGDFDLSENSLIFTLDTDSFFTLYNDAYTAMYCPGDNTIVKTPSFSSGNECNNLPIWTLADYSLVYNTMFAPYKTDLAEKIKYFIGKNLYEYFISYKDINEEFANKLSTPEGGLVSEYYCLNLHHNRVLSHLHLHDFEFIDKCELVKVRESIEVEVDEEILLQYITYLLTLQGEPIHLVDCFTINASLTLLEKNDVLEDIIYYFPKYGLLYKFKKDTIQIRDHTYTIITPVIIQVESESDEANWILRSLYDFCFRHLYFADGIEYPEISMAEIYPNRYLLIPKTNSIILDFTKLLEIPGIETIDVSGRFEAHVDNMPIELIPGDRFALNVPDSGYGRSVSLRNGEAELNDTPLEVTFGNSDPAIDIKYVSFAANCPNISNGHIYEYHMKDGVFSYIDVTPSTDANSEGEAGRTTR